MYANTHALRPANPAGCILLVVVFESGGVFLIVLLFVCVCFYPFYVFTPRGIWLPVKEEAYFLHSLSLRFYHQWYVRLFSVLQRIVILLRIGELSVCYNKNASFLKRSPIMSESSPILVSACLLGVPCRYDGTNNRKWISQQKSPSQILIIHNFIKK